MGEFAPIITKVHVEQDVIQCLQDWLSVVLADIEDDVPGLAKGQIGRPRSWQRDIDVRKLPEQAIPAVVCVVGEGVPIDDGGYVHMSWPLVVGLITRGKSRQEGRDVVGYYGGAIMGAIAWKLTAQPRISSVMLTGIDFGEREGDPGIVGADVQVSFTVMTQAVLSKFGGPRPGDAPPEVPPEVPTWPTFLDDPTVADADYNPKIDTVEPVPTPEPFEED